MFEVFKEFELGMKIVIVGTIVFMFWFAYVWFTNLGIW